MCLCRLLSHRCKGRQISHLTYLLRELYILVLADPPLGELGAVVRHLIHQHAATKGPHTGKHKLVLQQLLVWGGCAAHSLLHKMQRHALMARFYVSNSRQYAWQSVAMQQCLASHILIASTKLLDSDGGTSTGCTAS